MCAFSARREWPRGIFTEKSREEQTSTSLVHIERAAVIKIIGVTNNYKAHRPVMTQLCNKTGPGEHTQPREVGSQNIGLPWLLPEIKVFCRTGVCAVHEWLEWIYMHAHRSLSVNVHVETGNAISFAPAFQILKIFPKKRINYNFERIWIK